MPVDIIDKGSYNIDLQNAVRHLYAQKIISKDKEIAAKMTVGAGTVSNYVNGRSKASLKFRKSFEKAFGLSLEDFSNPSDTAFNGIEKPDSVDYRAKYIHKLEESEAFLKRIIEANLIDIAERQRTIQAEIQAVQQWDAQITAGGDEEALQASLRHIQKLVADNREKISKKGNPSYADRTDKGNP